MRHFRTLGTAWRERIEPIGTTPAATQVPCDDLPVSMKFALLYLRRGGTDSLYSKLTDVMMAMGISFKPSDFDQLRALGYVTREPSKHHVLTPNGLWKAGTLARELALQYQIHHVTFKEPTPRSNFGPSVSCTCGWGTCASKGNGNSLHRHAHDHLARVACGTWKAPRSVDEVFADVMMKQDQSTAYACGPGDPGAVVSCVPAAVPGIAERQGTQR